MESQYGIEIMAAEPSDASEPGPSEEDELLARHRKEVKDLRGMLCGPSLPPALSPSIALPGVHVMTIIVLKSVVVFTAAKIQALKKTIPKGDKKKKKEVRIQ